MKSRKGFIQIPLLIAIIVGVLVLGGGGYFGVKQYQNYRADELSEVAKLRQEVEELKNQSLQNQNKVVATTKEIVSVTTTGKRVVLTNAQIIAEIKPATVYIETNKGSGTGMIIESDGLVLTSAHVIKGATSITITLSDERVLSAELVGKDEIRDIALVRASASNLPTVKLGNSDLVSPGDDVFTLGYPFGIEGDVSFKEGTISRRLSDSDSEYLETSAEIHPGNSGGPLVNKYGEVVGVNFATIGQKFSGIIVGETIKLAIPINVAKKLMSDLKLGKNILPPKPPGFDEFVRYEKERISASDLEREALKLGVEAISLAVDEKYYSALSKIDQAINVLSTFIREAKSIHIPNVSFSDTIQDKTSYQIKYHEQYTLPGYLLMKDTYKVFSKTYTDIDVQLSEYNRGFQNYEKINLLYDEGDQFKNTLWFPKIGEYVGYAKPYLDIIYPKD